MNQAGKTKDWIHTFATAVSLGLNTHKCASLCYQLHSLAGKSASQIPHSDNEQISSVSRWSNSEPQRVRFIHKLLLKWVLHVVKRIIILRSLWPILETYVGGKSPPVHRALEQNRSAPSPPGPTTTSHWGLSATSLCSDGRFIFSVHAWRTEWKLMCKRLVSSTFVHSQEWVKSRTVRLFLSKLSFQLCYSQCKKRKERLPQESAQKWTVALYMRSQNNAKPT